MLIEVSALPYIKENEKKLLPKFLKDRAMGKGLGQNFVYSKSLRGFPHLVGAFFVFVLIPIRKEVIKWGRD